MKRILVASDSFKGTLSSLKICTLFENEAQNQNDFSFSFLPLADGGEGSLECVARAKNGRFATIFATDLYFNKKKTRYFVDENDNVYIEAAECVGLIDARKDNNPGIVTSFGIGEQIKDAINKGYKNIYIFLGGSASNDAGSGLVSALGVKFFNKDNKIFIPVGFTLKDISKIDVSECEKLLGDVNITVLSDVKSPLFGPNGAAYKFARQKGAKEDEIILLNENLKYFSSMIKEKFNIDLFNIEGSGAAGGIAGGLAAFCNAKIVSGIDKILDLIHFDELLKNVDIVISGEGKLDKQTFDGKVIDGVAKRCQKANKELNIIVGISELKESEIKSRYPCVNHLLETNENHLPFDSVKDNAEVDYKKQIKKLLLLLNK